MRRASGSLLGLLLSDAGFRAMAFPPPTRGPAFTLRPDSRDGFYSILAGSEVLVRSSLISVKTEDETLLSSDPRFTQVVGRRGEDTVLYLTDRRGVLDMALVGKQVESGMVLSLEVTNRQRGILRVNELFPIAATRPTRGGLFFGRTASDLRVLTDAWERSYGDAGVVNLAEKNHVDSAWDLHLFDRAGGQALSVSYYEIPNALIGLMLQHQDSGPPLELVVKADTRAGTRGLLLRPGATFRLSEILLRQSRGEPHEILLEYAEAIRARNALPAVKEFPSGWLDWYYNMGRSSGAGLETNLHALKRDLGPYGLGFVEIDSGWQRGVETEPPPHNVVAGGPWEPNSRFPRGMKSYADLIRSSGFRPGIWIRPFQMVEGAQERERFSPWFNEKGQMDTTRADVRDMIRQTVHRLVHEWGYEYLKVDFAAFDLYGTFGPELAKGVAAHAEPQDQSLTNVEAFRAALEVIHEAAGGKASILACNTLMPSTLGLASSFRVGDDVGEWDRIVRYGVPALSARYYTNGIYWANDPDVLVLGESLGIEECRAWASLVGLSGGAVFVSNNIPTLLPERLEIVKRLLPVYQTQGTRYGFARPVDFLDRSPATIWNLDVRTTFGAWNVVGIFNWTEEDEYRELTLEDLGLLGRTPRLLYDFWKGRFLGRSTGQVDLEIPYRSCLVLAAHPELDRPQLLSTTRHISQGGVECEAVQWDGATGVLSGRSTVIGGSPHQLVIHIPSPYRFREVGRGGSLVEEDEEIVRVLLAASESGPVNWEVRCSRS
jgi:hypothetical protein